MLSFAFALALFAAQDTTSAPAASATPAPTPAEDRWPTGAPRDEYQFVAWCYGALRGYLEMHDEMMPEVTRIESTFRRPGAKLSDDLKVYADMQKDGQAKLKLFQGALTAAEKASVRPINAVGATAVKQGRSIWTAGPQVTKARKAQEWMSWVLPAKCETTAANLENRAKLMGTAFRVNAPQDAAAQADPARADPGPAEQPAPEAPAAEPPTATNP